MVCYFCNDLKGVMVKAEGLGWTHITCMNWTPEVWFKDDLKISCGGKVNMDRFKLTCYICRKKGAGSCL